MQAFDRLMQIMETLRGPGGCPWDAKQTHKSLKKSLIEECYELADAIEKDDPGHIMEELGDVLLQVIFHATIAKETGAFTIEDVINGLCDKLVYRHPHVFSDASVSDAEEVIRNWEKLKRKEDSKKERSSILSGIPEKLPPLLYALKIQSTTSRVGFDWDGPRGVIEKIYEEINELNDAMTEDNVADIEEEIGR